MARHEQWGAHGRRAFPGLLVGERLTQGTQWPGFRYTEDERATMQERAKRVGGGRFVAFMAWTTILFVAGAGLLVGFGMVPLLGWFWPEAARMPAAGFFGVLAAVIALSLGPILLAALRAGAWLADGFGRVRADGGGALAAGEAALLAKVRWQLIRMALVLGGLFVPGALVWSTLNAELRGGILWTLQAVYVLVMLLAIVGLVAGRRARR